VSAKSGIVNLIVLNGIDSLEMREMTNIDVQPKDTVAILLHSRPIAQGTVIRVNQRTIRVCEHWDVDFDVNYSRITGNVADFGFGRRAWSIRKPTAEDLVIIEHEELVRKVEKTLEELYGLTTSQLKRILEITEYSHRQRGKGNV
jgi:hypothetical protein